MKKQRMPILNWTACEKMDALSPLAEIFLTRLYMSVDSNGCIAAHPKILRGTLFPLRIDSISDNDVNAWLAECIEAGLIDTYRVEGVNYLHIATYEAGIRRKRQNCPEPPGVSAWEPEAVNTPKAITVKHTPTARAVEDKPIRQLPDWLTMTENDMAKCDDEPLK